MQIDAFLTRWRNAGGSERATKPSGPTRPEGSPLVVRPRFQNRTATFNPEKQAKIDFPETAVATAKPAEKRPWPPTLPEQVAAIAQTLADSPLSLNGPEIAERFTGKGAWKKRLPQLLETLVALGRARMSDDGPYGENR